MREISVMKNLKTICMQAKYTNLKFETSLQVLKMGLEKHLNFVYTGADHTLLRLHVLIPWGRI